MAGFELYAPRAANHRRTWTWATIVLGFVFILLGQIAAAIPIGFQRAMAIRANPAVAHTPVHIDAAPFMLWSNVILIALVLLWMMTFERRKPSAIGLGTGVLKFARGYIVGGVLFGLVAGGVYLAGGFQVNGPGFWQAPTAAGLVPLLFFVGTFMVQGSGEEVVMRGWLMQIISSRHGLMWGVVINSVLFGFLHFFNEKPAPDLYMGVFNIMLYAGFVSLYAAKEKSLWGVCGIHAAWNYVQGPGVGLDVSGIKLGVAPLFVALGDKPGAPEWLTGGNFGPEASVATTIVMGLGVVWMVMRGLPKQTDSFPVQTTETGVSN